MFVPFLTPCPKSSSRLSRRRGGGKSGGSTSSSAGKGGSSSSSSSAGKGSSSTGGKSTGSTGSSSSSTGKTITGYNKGGGKLSTIPSGQLFSGRSQGGATRNQVWGSRAYGSGYPGTYTRGVSGRDFPFYFWPLAWGTGLGYGANTAYLHSDEYGQPNNSSRPGGAMATAVFQSNSTGTTFRVSADNDTVTDLLADIAANCSAFLVPSSVNATRPTPFNLSAPDAQKPEQVVQYYRASSVALSLDGYNNTAVFMAENSTADTPLPTGIDTTLLECLNTTIGLAVPLVDGAPSALSVPSFGLLAIVFLMLRTLL
ncbi:hypothetical protein DFH09DRAFT_910764 [Mycena vulgaris]|nr:hypothetical protein DFH09DRAFT_910764 [Mycena vulgaris]